MVEIGHEAGVSQPRLSQMFRSKQNLFTDALGLACEEIAEQGIAHLPNPYDADAAAAMVTSLARSNPNVLRLTYHAVAASQDPQIATAVNSALLDFHAALTERGATPQQMNDLSAVWMGAASSLVLRFRTPDEKSIAAKIFPALAPSADG